MQQENTSQSIHLVTSFMRGMQTLLARNGNKGSCLSGQCGLCTLASNVQTKFHKFWMSHCNPPLTESRIFRWHGWMQRYVKKQQNYSPLVWKLKVGVWQHWKSGPQLVQWGYAYWTSTKDSVTTLHVHVHAAKQRLGVISTLVFCKGSIPSVVASTVIIDSLPQQYFRP